MKVVVTGGTGFIGMNLRESLPGKCDAIFPTTKDLNLVDENSVKSFFKEDNYDVVIHCATWDAKWNSRKDPSKILDRNVRMFLNLSREKNHFGRLINLGSGAEFSKPHWIPLATEGYFGAHIPEDPYGFSKYIINKYIEGTPGAVNLRLFGVFGQYEDWRTRFISNVICRAIYDLPIVIIQDVLFDYLYVEDLMAVIDWFLKNDPMEKTYNVCTGRTYRLSDLAKMILHILDKDLPVEIIRKGYGTECSGDNSRLLFELRDFQFTPMEKAIGALVRWYRAHIDQVPYEEIKANKRVLIAQQEDGGRHE